MLFWTKLQKGKKNGGKGETGLARVLALTVFEEDTLCPHSASLYFDKWKNSSA